MERLSGSVERITFYNPENGYSVVRLRPDRARTPGMNRSGLVTVTGNLPELSAGEHLQLQGRWVTHPKHGLQFQIEICEQTLPATAVGIQRYLGSGMIKGIGPRLAERIVSHFGDQTLEVIDNHPERLREVPDIGPKRTRLIAKAWDDQRQVKEIMLFLHGHGVSTNLAIKIYKQYGDEAFHIVRTDPYRLARDIFGVGFKTADRLAQDLGLSPEHPSRVEAGVLYTLNELVDEGHVYTPQPALIEQSSALLELNSELIPPALTRLSQEDLIRFEVLPEGMDSDQLFQNIRAKGSTIREPPAVYLTPFYHGERGVAERLRDIALALPSRLSDLPPAFVTLDPDLSGEQRTAIQTALTHPVSVLTGGPGTGKTTSIRALISVIEAAGKRFALAAPTGRAAKRLSEATGRPASTIHRLLGYSPLEGFSHNTDHPLPVDLVVVDECSMLDLLLAYNLLKAVETGTHLLLVGDVDQLPSVGAGDVLRDVIASGLTPVTRLSVIFRQATESLIITNAHKINQGEMPQFPRARKSETGSNEQISADFFLFPAENADDAADWIIELVCERIPATFGHHPIDDIQVLSPMYRGAAGVHALNARLQARLNPPGVLKPERTLFGQIFRPGDKVMQVQNDYDKDVFNGDIGKVVSISPIEHTLTVDFEGRHVVYDWSEGDQLVLAYAVSVHKSQGAEFPAVVVPLVTQHYMMLQRNLLYTAVSRARQLCVLVGNRKAINIAVRNDKVAHRNTALDWRLLQG